MIELKHKRKHNIKEFLHPTNVKKRIVHIGIANFHYFDGKEFREIQKLPFPDGKIINNDDDLEMIEIPSWGEARLEENNKVVKIYDKLDVPIYKFHSPIVSKKNTAVFQKVEFDKNNKKIILYTINYNNLEFEKNNLELNQKIEPIEKNILEKPDFEIKDNKICFKLSTPITEPLRAYDDTDTSSTNNQDTYLSNWGPTADRGAELILNIDTSSGEISRVCIKFTMPSLSGTVSDVTLYLYGYFLTEGNHTINAHAITQLNWAENASWNTYDGTNAWSSVGGDYNATIIDSDYIDTVGAWYNWVLMGTGSTNPLTLDWEDRVDILLKNAGETTGHSIYRSKEYTADTSERPYLEIIYTPPTSRTIQSKVNILKEAIIKTIQAKAGILKEAIVKTIISKTRIQITQTKIIQAKARIQLTKLSNISAKGYISTGIITKTIIAKTSIKLTQIKTILANVRISYTQLKNVVANARIQRTKINSISAKGYVSITDICKTITASAYIVKTTNKIIIAKANIIVGYNTLVRGITRFPRGKIEVSWDNSKSLVLSEYQYIDESDYTIDIESYEELEGALGESVSSEIDFTLANNTERFYPKEFKNKLKNPSFELASTPTFWSTSTSGIGVINTSTVRTRLRSYKIDSANGYIVSDNIYIASGLGEDQIQQNENWNLSSYLRGTGTAALKLYAFNITNEGQDLTTGLLDSNELTAINLTGSWARSEIGLLVPNGTVSLRAKITLESGGTDLYIDDCMVERGATATPFQDVDEAIWHLLLPSRPVKMSMGFAQTAITVSGIDYQEMFHGLTESLIPNLQEETIQIHCLDKSSKLMEMKIPSLMYTDQRTDQLMQYLAWAAGLGITEYSFETGTLTIPFAWFNDEESIWYWMKKIAEAENGRIFFDNNGILQFWNRDHYINNQTPVFNYTFDSNISSLSFDISSNKVVNHVIVKAKPRQEQVNQIIWILQGYETIPANSSLDYEVSVDDPCTVINQPTANADYLANTQSDGSGDDRTSSVTITEFNATAQKATMKINNTHPTDEVYITFFQVKGKPATVIHEMEVEVKDTESTEIYKDKVLEIENDYIQDADDAEALAKRRVIELRDPLDFIEIEVVGYPKLKVGDVVNIQDSYDGTTKKLFVVSNRISFADEIVQFLRLESKILNF